MFSQILPNGLFRLKRCKITAFFSNIQKKCIKICIYQKKAVILHPLLKKSMPDMSLPSSVGRATDS